MNASYEWAPGEYDQFLGEQAAGLAAIRPQQHPIQWWANWYQLRLSRRFREGDYIKSKWQVFWNRWAMWVTGTTTSPVGFPFYLARKRRAWIAKGRPAAPPIGYGYIWEYVHYYGWLTRLTYWLLTRFQEDR